jgi:hypothetical protein
MRQGTFQEGAIAEDLPAESVDEDMDPQAAWSAAGDGFLQSLPGVTL